MSVSNIFYITTSFSPTIPALLQFTELSQENRFDEQNTMMQKAHEEARGGQKGFGSHKVTKTAKSFCLHGLISGIAGAIFFKNPLPLILGLHPCLPRAHAQQKVGNEFQVNTWTDGRQVRPSVTSFSNGNFVVSWQSDSQDIDFSCIAQLFDGNGTKIGNEFSVGSMPGNDLDPSVTSFSNDNFVVTREGLDGFGYGIWARLYTENGTRLGTEFQANSYTARDQQNPSVARFSNDNFVVTWNSNAQDGSADGVYGQLFTENGRAIGSEFQVNSYTNNTQSSPYVASLSNDNFVVTWRSSGQDGSSYGVYGQLFDKFGFTIGSEFQVNTYTSSSQQYPSVASFSNGNFVVTWESYDQDGSGYGIYGQLFNGNGAKIGSEFRANTYTTGSQGSPSVASFTNGNFVVTWQSNSQDGSNYGVYGQLFNGNGSNIGSEFQVNTYITDWQGFPSVASFSNGNFVVTWHSDGQDGSSYGIFGQIFNDFLVSRTRSTIKTASSTTSSVSSNTIPTTTTIDRTRISVNPRSSSSATALSTPRATISAISDASKSFLSFLLRGV